VLSPPVRRFEISARLRLLKVGSTVRYLGIEVDDAVEIAEQTEI
jgi:hypothetical protein